MHGNHPFSTYAKFSEKLTFLHCEKYQIPNFLVWKFCGKTQIPHRLLCAFPQKLQTRKFGEITVFFAVLYLHTYTHVCVSGAKKC